MSSESSVTEAQRDKAKVGRKPVEIRAMDILSSTFVVAPVICVDPQKTVREVALLLSGKKISAVPVIKDGKIIGIVSEGDLLQRRELGSAMTKAGVNICGEDRNKDRSYGKTAGDVMTRTLVTVSPDTSLHQIVETLLAKNIKRVLVMQDEELVGIVSRSDVVRLLAARPEGMGDPMSDDDDMIRFKVIRTLMRIPGTTPWQATVTVEDGIVEISGTIDDEDAREPSRAAIANIPHVVEVRDKRAMVQPF